jgi:hypothetical protein
MWEFIVGMCIGVILGLTIKIVVVVKENDK